MTNSTPKEITDNAQGLAARLYPWGDTPAILVLAVLAGIKSGLQMAADQDYTAERNARDDFGSVRRAAYAESSKRHREAAQQIEVK